MRISIVWHVTVQYFGRMGVQMLLFVFISGMHAYVGLIPLFDFKRSKELLNISYPCHHPLIDILIQYTLHDFGVMGINVLRRSLWFGWYRFDIAYDLLLLPDCIFNRYLGYNAITLIPAGMVDTNTALEFLCVCLNCKSSKAGWIPILYFRRSKTAPTLHLCHHSLIDILNRSIYFTISVGWVLICRFAVCGLADTDLMVHIVASRLLISQPIGQQRHHFDPSRIGWQQPSSGGVVRVLESWIKQSRTDLNLILNSDNQKLLPHHTLATMHWLMFWMYTSWLQCAWY